MKGIDKDKFEYNWKLHDLSSALYNSKREPMLSLYDISNIIKEELTEEDITSLIHWLQK